MNLLANPILYIFHEIHFEDKNNCKTNLKIVLYYKKYTTMLALMLLFKEIYMQLC